MTELVKRSPYLADLWTQTPGIRSPFSRILFLAPFPLKTKTLDQPQPSPRTSELILSSKLTLNNGPQRAIVPISVFLLVSPDRPSNNSLYYYMLPGATISKFKKPNYFTFNSIYWTHIGLMDLHSQCSAHCLWVIWHSQVTPETWNTSAEKAFMLDEVAYSNWSTQVFFFNIYFIFISVCSPPLSFIIFV